MLAEPIAHCVRVVLLGLMPLLLSEQHRIMIINFLLLAWKNCTLQRKAFEALFQLFWRTILNVNIIYAFSTF